MFLSNYIRLSLFNHGSSDKVMKIKNAYIRHFVILVRSSVWGLCHLKYYIHREYYFPKLEILLPRGCPFDCKCCIHFIPDYKDTICESAESVIDDMKKLLQVVDRIDEVSISGGDAFLYPHLYDVLQYLLTSDKIGKISFVTTGAVSPEKKVISLLNDKRLELKVDNYGSYSEKIDEFTALSYSNVKYYGIYDEWSDFGDEVCRHRNNAELDLQYKSCKSERFCLLNGKIYACPRCAHGENLKYFICKEEEHVNLRSSKDRGQLLFEIRELRRLKHLTSCNYCNSCTEDFKTYNIKERFRDANIDA